ncbi:probable coatomer subunit beta' [Oscarella lobularis]|uniref:probable coatomer subunit beta' n=1 Tax=Oscarella lobularis TaxID=121494 RepID=UPI003313B868
MDSNGKILWARHNEIQQANLKSMGDSEHQDGERLPLAMKDMSACEIYPQMIMHNPNGRFVCVCGNGEYIIYTAMALRNKSYGSAQEFVWANDSSQYAHKQPDDDLQSRRRTIGKLRARKAFRFTSVDPSAMQIPPRRRRKSPFFREDSPLLHNRRRTDISKNNLYDTQEGDPKYLAPELLQNQFGNSADVFSLGMTLLELSCDIDFPSFGEAWHVLRSGHIPETTLEGNKILINNFNYFIHTS